MRQKVIDGIKEIAKAQNLSIDFSNTSTTLKDLNIDSLAAMNLIMELEEKLNVTLDDEILLSIKTLGELIISFEKKLSNSN